MLASRAEHGANLGTTWPESLLTPSSLNRSSRAGEAISLASTVKIGGEQAAVATSEGTTGQLTQLQAINSNLVKYSKQMEDLNLRLEGLDLDLLEKYSEQIKIIDSKMQGHSDHLQTQSVEMKLLLSSLQDNAEQMKLLNFNIMRGHYGISQKTNSPEALQQRSPDVPCNSPNTSLINGTLVESNDMSVASEDEHLKWLQAPPPEDTHNSLEISEAVALPSERVVQTESKPQAKGETFINDSVTLVNEYSLSSSFNSLPHLITTESLDRSILTSDKTNLRFVSDLFLPHNAVSKNQSHNRHMAEIVDALQKKDETMTSRARGLGSFQSRWVLEPDRTSPLARLLRSPCAEYFVCLVILANSVLITYCVDYSVDHPNESEIPLLIALELIFQVYYIFEMILRLSVHRLYLFTNRDSLWNILDFALVIAAIYDILISHLFNALDISVSGPDNGFSWTLLRLLRLVRIMKVMRLFRVVRFFSELNVLLRVVTSNLKSLFWCTLMLIVFIYIFAVILVHGTASYMSSGNADSLIKEQLLKMFGSVGTAMLSLAKACSGGEDWGPLGDSLSHLGTIYYSLYILFIGFTFLALMNILTGLFVDRTFKAVADDHDGVALEKLHNDRIVVQDLCGLYCSMTGDAIDSDRTISAIAFQEAMSSPVMRARMAALDLEVWDSMRFFDMLTSINKNGELDLQSWVTGCMQMRGLASRISVQALHADLHRLKKTVISMNGSSRSGGTTTTLFRGSGHGSVESISSCMI